MKKLLYGTSNMAKLEPMKRMASELNIEIIGLDGFDTSGLGEIEESSDIPLENARIKALAYYTAFGVPVFSCDSGLYFDNVPDKYQPGARIRRVHGEYLNDEEMISYYSALAKKFGGRLTAKYINSICLVKDLDNIVGYDGEDIASERFFLISKSHKDRTHGFPLDSISIHIDTGKYYMDIKENDYYKTKDSWGIDLGFRRFFRENVLCLKDKS